jgi:cystathionine beta-lyase
MTSGSKAFNIAGLKCAMVVTADPATRSVMRGVPNAFTDHVGYLGVLATEAGFEAGDEWLDAVVAQLDRNRTLLADGLREHLPEVRWRPPQATYLAWLDCRELGLADPAATFLANGRVAVSPGPAYGKQGDGFVRLNFGTSPELVSEMVMRMARAVGRG